MSYDTWLERNMLDDPLSDNDLANLLGSLCFPTGGRTARERGKIKTLVSRYSAHEQLRAQYLEEVPEIEEEVPLGDSEADRAYIRTRLKRAKWKQSQTSSE